MKDTKPDVKRLRAKVGYKEALKLLMDSGASKSVAEKLLAGTYEHQVGPLLQRAIDDALKNAS